MGPGPPPEAVRGAGDLDIRGPDSKQNTGKKLRPESQVIGLALCSVGLGFLIDKNRGVQLDVS